MNKKLLPECPVATFLQLVGNKWRVLIIRDLMGGTKRFGELRRSVGCSQKVLTDNLRELENNKIITRTIFPEVPPRVEYKLTDIGNTLRPILKAIEKWGTMYKNAR